MSAGRWIITDGLRWHFDAGADCLDFTSGPDGEVRRTFGDMFFAEVRPFEEIFRRDQSGAAENENQNQNQSGNQGGNQGTRLAELQKQIVIATWKLRQTKTVEPKESKP